MGKGLNGAWLALGVAGAVAAAGAVMGRRGSRSMSSTPARLWTTGELRRLPSGTVLSRADGMVWIRDTRAAGDWIEGHPDLPFLPRRADPFGMLKRDAISMAQALVSIAEPRRHGTWIMVPDADLNFANMIDAYLNTPEGQARFSERVRKFGYQDKPRFDALELSDRGGSIIVPREPEPAPSLFTYSKPS